MHSKVETPFIDASKEGSIMSDVNKPKNNPIGACGTPAALANARKQECGTGNLIAMVIERSQNPNIVVYAPKLVDGKIGDELAEVYWLRNETDGHREELDFLQRSQGYGLKKVEKVVRFGKEAIKCVIVPMPSLPLYLQDNGDGSWSAYMDFPQDKENGFPERENVRVERIWIQCTSNFIGIPKVWFVDVMGFKDGEAVTYRIIP